MTSHHLSLSSDELDLLKSDELSTELKSDIVFTKKVCTSALPSPFFRFVFVSKLLFF